MRNLSDAALQLELEKAQRLVWMIEKEIRWRRTLRLEEEVRKEMMIEREMAMRRANGLGFLLEAPPVLPPESCFTLLGLNAFNMAPSPRPEELSAINMAPSPRKAEIDAGILKRESEGSKEKLIVLPKPNQTHFEKKRRARVEEENGETAEFEFKKKAKQVKVVQEWRCELCNIWTTNENGLNDHFGGKKHIAKEKARTQKIDSQKSTDFPSLKPVASSCSKMEAKPDTREDEVDDSLNSSGLQSVKKDC